MYNLFIKFRQVIIVLVFSVILFLPVNVFASSYSNGLYNSGVYNGSAATPTPTSTSTPTPTDTPTPILTNTPTPSPTDIPTPTNTDTPTPTSTSTPTPTPTIIPTYTLSGTVFVDTNQNGVQDNGELGYGNVTITVSGTQNGSANTTSTGEYSIANLNTGNYSVSIAIPSGYQLTTSNPVSVPLSSNTTVNFGIIAQVTQSSSSTNTTTTTTSSGTGYDPNFPTGFYSRIMAGPNYVGSTYYISGQGIANLAQSHFPKGAIHDDVTVDITYTPPENLSSTLPKVPFPWMQKINIAGEIYKFQATAAFNGMLIQQFDKPVIIILPYDVKRIAGIDPRKLKIVMFNKKTRRWQFLTTPMVVNTSQQTISTTVTSFSYFTVGYARK